MPFSLLPASICIVEYVVVVYRPGDGAMESVVLSRRLGADPPILAQLTPTSLLNQQTETEIFPVINYFLSKISRLFHKPIFSEFRQKTKKKRIWRFV